MDYIKLDARLDSRGFRVRTPLPPHIIDELWQLVSPYVLMPSQNGSQTSQNWSQCLPQSEVDFARKASQNVSQTASQNTRRLRSINGVFGNVIKYSAFTQAQVLGLRGRFNAKDFCDYEGDVLRPKIAAWASQNSQICDEVCEVCEAAAELENPKSPRTPLTSTLTSRYTQDNIYNNIDYKEVYGDENKSKNTEVGKNEKAGAQNFGKVVAGDAQNFDTPFADDPFANLSPFAVTDEPLETEPLFELPSADEGIDARGRTRALEAPVGDFSVSVDMLQIQAGENPVEAVTGASNEPPQAPEETGRAVKAAKKAPKEPKEPKRFVPPSVEEVAAHIAEKGYGFDAEQFVAFYTSKGWKVGSQAMKDWKAACVTWNKRTGQHTWQDAGRHPPPANTPPPKPTGAMVDVEGLYWQLQQSEWLKTCAAHQKIAETEAQEWLLAFTHEQQDCGYTQKTEQDYQAHFVRWLKIELNKKQKTYGNTEISQKDLVW